MADFPFVVYAAAVRSGERPTQWHSLTTKKGVEDFAVAVTSLIYEKLVEQYNKDPKKLKPHFRQMVAESLLDRAVRTDFIKMIAETVIEALAPLLLGLAAKAFPHHVKLEEQGQIGVTGVEYHAYAIPKYMLN